MAGIADLIAEQAGAPAAAEPELGKPEAAPVEAKAEQLGVEDDGKPQPIPYGRFAEVNVKRKAAEERASKLDTELKTARERVEAFERVYGKFEKPHEQMQQDADFANAVWELREDPDVAKALAKINQHYHGAKKVTERAEKPAESTPAVDPRVEQLVAERVKDRAQSLLSEAKVRPELHGAILDYVTRNNPNPTREAVLTLMQEYVNSQGWTKQFLRGSDPTKRSVALPNPGGLNAGAPKDKAPASTEKPKNLSGLQEQNRNKLRELMQQRGLA